MSTILANRHADSKRHMTVFGINRPPRHCFIGWEVYDRVVCDIASALGISRHGIVALHDIGAAVHGVTRDRNCVILQRQGDMALTDSRAVVLWELHEHHAAVKMSNRFAGWWFQIFFIFHPYLGKIPILTHIFQRGWFNHQLDII